MAVFVFLKYFSKGVLPQNFDFSRKQGFSIPLKYWLKDPFLKDLFYSAVNTENSIFERSSINEILKNQDKGYSNSENIFALTMFQLWKDKFNAYL